MVNRVEEVTGSGEVLVREKSAAETIDDYLRRTSILVGPELVKVAESVFQGIMEEYQRRQQTRF